MQDIFLINFFTLEEIKPNIFVEKDFLDKSIELATLEEVISFCRSDFNDYSFLLYGGSGEVDGIVITHNNEIIYKELSPDTPCQTGNSAIPYCFLNSEGKINIKKDEKGIFYYIAIRNFENRKRFTPQSDILILVDKYNINDQRKNL